MKKGLKVALIIKLALLLTFGSAVYAGAAGKENPGRSNPNNTCTGTYNVNIGSNESADIKRGDKLIANTTVENGQLLSWELKSDEHEVTCIYVKASDDGNSYHYDSGVTGDSGLFGSTNKKGKYQDISHYLVYFNDKPKQEEPGDEEPGDEEPGDEEPGDEEPGDEEPGDEEPGDEELGDEEPGDEEPGDEEPGDEEPGDEEEPGEKPVKKNPIIPQTPVVEEDETVELEDEIVDLEEESVPLGAVEEVVTPEAVLEDPVDEEVMILDEVVPLAALPQTGESNPLPYYLLGTLLAGAGLATRFKKTTKTSN